ncbi:hypothetical protein C2G38_2170381 [Gigaspora rosea]|uniref:F-box domain-containing protein n=1 Tax=Gigaspora rosea TaxID=44941 RepID=A0A397VP44_9GLOM|nr:hypothetical protein C2G38_2170381 [Gigaspora rosea]
MSFYQIHVNFDMTDIFQLLMKVDLHNKKSRKSPILWQNPFSFNKKPLFISEYFSSLDEDESYILKEYGINLKISRKLFNYAKFLKDLNLFGLKIKAREWTNLMLIKPISSYFDTLENVIFNLLLKLIFESGTVLHELNLSFPYSFEVKPEIFYSIGRNELLFSRLQHLSLSFSESCNYSDYGPRLFHSLFHAIIRIIKSQEQLKRCAYNKEFEVLKDCKTLETLRIRDCSSKLLNLLDCKISTLETIPLILRNSGLSLQQLSFEPENLDDNFHEELFFLEALKSFCQNITYLHISNIELSIHLLELIDNLHKLQFLSLQCFFVDDIQVRVIQFAEILPLTLQYLDLGNTWQPFMDIFLSHCNAPLKKLLIYRLNNEEHIRALIEFCIRNKALNYVGIYKYSDLDENFRKEVEAHVTNVALVPRARIVEFL